MVKSLAYQTLPFRLSSYFQHLATSINFVFYSFLCFFYPFHGVWISIWRCKLDIIGYYAPPSCSAKKVVGERDRLIFTGKLILASVIVKSAGNCEMEPWSVQVCSLGQLCPYTPGTIPVHQVGPIAPTLFWPNQRFTHPASLVPLYQSSCSCKLLIILRFASWDVSKTIADGVGRTRGGDVAKCEANQRAQRVYSGAHLRMEESV